MKRCVWVLALLVAAGACGGGENVVVRASLGEEGGQPVPDLPVRLLPYDRQGILDSLAKADESPAPVLPADALEQLRSLQAEEARVKQQGDTAAVTRAQARRRAYLAQLDNLRKARAKWLDDRRTEFEAAAKDRNAKGLPEKTDTTDARGRAAFSADEGRWWAVAQYVLPDRVLEWSVPVRVREGRDSVVVHLDRRNAKAEPFF
jgi:pimeloyl-ACP methyl ester carboxylesterase